MSEKTDTSSDDPGESSITVSRVAPAADVSSREIVRAVTSALDGREIRSIDVAVVDDATIASLHQRYLNDPSPTDVLAFDLRDDARDVAIEGQIVTSIDMARQQAGALKVDVKEELLRYVIHGTLHLMGYDDDTSARRSDMRLAEDRVLQRVNATAGARSSCKKRRNTDGV